jgi:hypothetical protein
MFSLCRLDSNSATNGSNYLQTCTSRNLVRSQLEREYANEHYEESRLRKLLAPEIRCTGPAPISCSRE